MELDSGADSMSSTPRAAHHGLDNKSVVRLMCSFGGKILPRPHDNQLRYVGGDTRIVAINRASSFPSLVLKLSKLLGPQRSSDFCIKYQLPNEDLDALITVSTDEDVENMMEEFERLTLQQNNNSSSSNNNRVPRLRLFLFPTTGVNDDTSGSSSIVSLLDGSRKRENWFFDALNGGGAQQAPSLERVRSEASSIVSEVPDYLFGLDNSDEQQPVKMKNRAGLSDVVPGSDPGSPAFGSTSSVPPMPNLPPVKTKPENPDPVQETGEPPGQLVGAYGVPGGGHAVWGNNSNPSSPYRVHSQGPAPVQTLPVYYVPAGPGQGLVPHRNAHMQPVPVPFPIQGHFVQQYPSGQVQIPVRYPSSGPIYGGGAVQAAPAGVDPYEMQIQGNMVPVHGSSGLGQPLYYALKNGGSGMVANYPGMVIPVPGDEAAASGLDAPKGRTQQP